MNYRQQAINLFVQKTKYTKEEIKSCIPIHNGFTNISYKIKLKNNTTYQVRIGNDHHQINRHNEQLIYRLIKFPYFIYYDVETGNAIKKWIEGKNPSYRTILSTKFLKSFAVSLKCIHKIKTNLIQKHDYFDCFKQAKLPLKHQNAYKILIKKYLKMPLVLSHNDLSADNLIYTHNGTVIFIDYEWARMNNQY
jgi:thiamine kinase-like enzyme